MKWVYEVDIRIELEQSKKQTKSTKFEHMSSLQISTWCRPRSVEIPKYDNHASNCFGGTQMFLFLLSNMYLIHPLMLTVLLPSIFGNFWATGFELFDCCPSSIPILLGLRPLEAVFWEVLWTASTGMEDSLNETWVVWLSSLSSLLSLEAVVRQSCSDNGCGCTGCISLEVVNKLSGSKSGYVCTVWTSWMSCTVSMMTNLGKQNINLIGVARKRKV